ncbi:MAG: class I SAM-dependent methyltransferase [Verrucomicrobiota bacterium]
MTSPVFDEYANYYDLLYQDKDYEAEVNYIDESISSRIPPRRKLLELGSGTGIHGILLAEKGYHVQGIELSSVMVEQAATRAHDCKDHQGSFQCRQGDARTTNTGETYDAVLALFHVVSYQIEDNDVSQMFQNARRHLENSGTFFFDVWHTPAVQSQQPEVRVKRMQSDKLEITRIAEPSILTDQIVEVNYTLFARDLESNTIREARERHSMRHFTPDEIAEFASEANFTVKMSAEFGTGASPSQQTWGVGYLLEPS